MSDLELGIDKNPEFYADPKQIIKEAIKKSREGLTKRRRNKLSISELYLPIGQKISLQALERLPSYVKFKQFVRNAFIKINYLH